MVKKQVIDLLQFIRKTEKSNNDESIFDTLIEYSNILESIFDDMRTCFQIDGATGNDILFDDMIGTVFWEVYSYDNIDLEQIIKRYEFEEEEKIIELFGHIENLKPLSKIFYSVDYGTNDFHLLCDNKDLIIRIIRNRKAQRTIDRWLIEMEDEKLRLSDYEIFATEIMWVLEEEK